MQHWQLCKRWQRKIKSRLSREVWSRWIPSLLNGMTFSNSLTPGMQDSAPVYFSLFWSDTIPCLQEIIFNHHHLWLNCLGFLRVPLPSTWHDVLRVLWSLPVLRSDICRWKWMYRVYQIWIPVPCCGEHSLHPRIYHISNNCRLEFTVN